ncbi:MAG: primosomal protein N' [Gammaproteobacteria bacterium]
MTSETVYRVAVATPLMRLFDYLPPHDADTAGQRGQRVEVPFGRTRRVGVICAVRGRSDVPPGKLRRAVAILDPEPLLDPPLMALLEWAADYYHHPPGDVFAAALPGALRKGGAAAVAGETAWRLTAAGAATDSREVGRRAKVQGEILARLCDCDDGLGKDALTDIGGGWRRAIRALEDKGLVERIVRAARTAGRGSRDRRTATAPEPNEEQRRAIESILTPDGFATFLLEGVTGSGKTEVYLRCIQRQLDAGKQTLVIVPEIGLTPQLVDRFRRRLNADIAVLHSGLNDTERLRAWCAARDGTAGVVIGTRSAVFAPLAAPGLIVIDEEHDSSLKQQEGFRYSARDLAVWRGRRLDVPVVLGSATPSFESLENVDAGRYAHVTLPRRPGTARQPVIRLIDLRRQAARDGLTEPLREAMSRHLDADGQVLVYLNRRGFAPALLCTACGQLVECRRCDARMVLHRGRGKLVCHHCGAEREPPNACDGCGAADLLPVGQGTERLETALTELFPDRGIVRIDRDTTRRRGEIGRKLEQVRSGTARILLGTQMLTKGHDFPNVTLVCIIDADQGLFGTDFRAAERLAQSFVQVAGRAGRGDRAGEVYIQTLFPDHPLLTTLIAKGYGAFASAAMDERRQAGWPPYAYLALLRAAAPARTAVFDFLAAAGDEARAVLGSGAIDGIRILGPAPAPMERRAARYHGQLLIHADRRARLQQFLGGWRERLDDLPAARRARWSIDVDPVELF